MARRVQTREPREPHEKGITLTSWIRIIVSGWRGGRPRRMPTDRSALVGMYLSNANRVSDASLRGAGTWERQEGKFSQNRRRG
jgi:hypothetical protein